MRNRMRRAMTFLLAKPAVTLAVCVVAVMSTSHAGPTALTLHYDAPASDWEREALPIGNGALGAMIFSGVDTDRIQFNEKTLWTGGPGSVKGYDFGIPSRSQAHVVREVASTIDRESRLEPDAVAARLGHKIKG